MAEQIIINVTDSIPPINQATIDLNGQTGNTYAKSQLDSKLNDAKSGIKGTATQSNAPTPYTVETYPNGLFESYKVTAPITSPNNWGNIAVTAGEIATNTVFFNVTNGVVTKELSLKTLPNYNTGTLSPTSTDKAETGKSVSDFISAQKSTPNALYSPLNTWLKAFNSLTDNANYITLLKLSEVIKDVLVSFPNGKPTEFVGRKLLIRSVQTGTLVFNWHLPTDSAWNNAYDFSITFTDISNGIRKIEKTITLFTKPITIKVYIDYSRFNEMPVTGTLIVSSAVGLSMSMEVQEKTTSVYDIAQFDAVEAPFVLDSATAIDKTRLRKILNAPRYADLFPKFASFAVPLTKLGIFTPTAKTSTTLTLSPTDASDIDIPMGLVCKMANGDYKICYFTAAASNVITLTYSFGETIDCNNVTALMAVHDTVRLGNGQHLSPWGYRAFAQLIANEMTTKRVMTDEYVGGFIAVNCSTVPAYLQDLNGTIISTPTYHDGFKTGGNTGIPGKVSGLSLGVSHKILLNSENRLGSNWATKAFLIKQGTAGAYIDIPFDIGYQFKGFAKVGIVNPNSGDWDGTARMIVLDEKNIEVYNQLIPRFADNVYIDLNSKFFSKLTFRFKIEEAKNTQVSINSIAIYKQYVEEVNFKPINNKSIVAVLGSSNTQYPLPSASYIGLVSGDTDNVVVTKPDGTSGDGYGYYPKELARRTGAVVDNWGSSGKTSEWGLGELNKIFQNKKYTHIILTLFGNDINALTPYDQIISNINEFCDYAKGFGCIPVVVMSYGTASSGQTVSYGELHERLLTGVYNISN